MSDQIEETAESGRDGPRCEQRLVRVDVDVFRLATSALGRRRARRNLAESLGIEETATIEQRGDGTFGVKLDPIIPNVESTHPEEKRNET